MHKDADDGTALLRADATWCAVPGDGGVRPMAVGCPGRDPRHSDTGVWQAASGGAHAGGRRGVLHGRRHLGRGGPLGTLTGRSGPGRERYEPRPDRETRFAESAKNFAGSGVSAQALPGWRRDHPPQPGLRRTSREAP
ncbi:AbfB domain-containing protein [Streptomyces shenzhenensis]|uniref:AbfB domain-containing protein n=1 Tax=Streptomyces shenzhenensis TaxID=943815 RepID=UPI0037F9242D